MTKTNKKTAKAAAREPLEYVKVLSECHDGQDVKVLMKDGSVRIVPKEDVEE